MAILCSHKYVAILHWYVHPLKGGCLCSKFTNEKKKNSSICLSCFGLTYFSLNYAFNSTEHNWQPKIKVSHSIHLHLFFQLIFFIEIGESALALFQFSCESIVKNFSNKFGIRVPVSILNEEFHHPFIAPYIFFFRFCFNQSSLQLVKKKKCQKHRKTFSNRCIRWSNQ